MKFFLVQISFFLFFSSSLWSQSIADAMHSSLFLEKSELLDGFRDAGYKLHASDPSINMYSFVKVSEKKSITVIQKNMTAYMFPDEYYSEKINLLRKDNDVRSTNRNEMSTRAKTWLKGLSPDCNVEYYVYKEKYSLIVVKLCIEGYSSCTNVFYMDTDNLEPK